MVRFSWVKGPDSVVRAGGVPAHAPVPVRKTAAARPAAALRTCNDMNALLVRAPTPVRFKVRVHSLEVGTHAWPRRPSGPTGLAVGRGWRYASEEEGFSMIIGAHS